MKKSSKIREIREKTGLSQAKFGKKYGISPSTVNSWECLTSTPTKMTELLLERFVLEDSDGNFPKKPIVLGVGVKRLLEMSGLTRKEFSDKYKIPFETLKRWIYGGKPAEYVMLLLERAVREDTYEPWKSYLDSEN